MIGWQYWDTGRLVSSTFSPGGRAKVGPEFGRSEAGRASLALERALAKCLHSGRIGQALQLGLVLVQKTCKTYRMISTLVTLSSFFWPTECNDIFFWINVLWASHYLSKRNHLIMKFVQSSVVKLAQPRPQVLLDSCLDRVPAQTLFDWWAIYSDFNCRLKSWRFCVVFENIGHERYGSYEFFTYSSSRCSWSSSGSGSNGTQPSLTQMRPTFVSTCHKLLIKHWTLHSYLWIFELWVSKISSISAAIVNKCLLTTTPSVGCSTMVTSKKWFTHNRKASRLPVIAP